MAFGNKNSVLMALFMAVLILLPLLPCDAGRDPTLSNRRVPAKQPICPACVCCEPPPSGSCCRCCASPITTQNSLDHQSP